MKTGSKIVLAVLGYIVGSMLGGMLAFTLRLTPPAALPGTSPSADMKAMIVAGVILGLGLAPLALGLGGKFIARWAALFALIYVACGVNTVIEISIFSTFFKGTYPFLLVIYIFSAMLAAAAFAFVPAKIPEQLGARNFGASGWAWRLGAAWLAFPVIYFLFGMMVGPIVLKYYTSSPLGFVIPSFPIIIRTQLVRSALFLAASLPLVLLWTKSRRGLMISLGLAHATVVGLMGLVSAYWMPTTMREAHSIEITADSFVYAAVLTLLFFKKNEATLNSDQKTAMAAGA